GGRVGAGRVVGVGGSRLQQPELACASPSTPGVTAPQPRAVTIATPQPETCPCSPTATVVRTRIFDNNVGCGSGDAAAATTRGHVGTERRRAAVAAVRSGYADSALADND